MTAPRAERGGTLLLHGLAVTAAVLLGLCSAQTSTSTTTGNWLQYVPAGIGPTLGNGPTIFSTISIGNNSACGIDNSTQRVWCWGNNDDGQLGQGDTKTRGRGDGNGNFVDCDLCMPYVDLGGPTARAKDVKVGLGYACALLVDGTVKCWGSNDVGQLGQGDNVTRGDRAGTMGLNLPPINFPGGKTAKQIAVGTGSGTVCAILSDNSLVCWGKGNSNALGYGDNITRGTSPSDMSSLPAVNLGTGKYATQIEVGNGFSCAILNDGSLKCWGFGGNGRLGNGNYEAPQYATGDALPTVNLGTGVTVKQISCGVGYACAVLNNNSAKCWGDNTYGNLGLGNGEWRDSRGVNPGEMGDNLPLVNLGGRNVSQIAAGFRSTCAVFGGADAGKMTCWGANAFFQLGLGDSKARGNVSSTMGNASVLPAINFPKQVAMVDFALTQDACAVFADGTASCWGLNSNGQSGYGDNSNRGYNAGGYDTMYQDLVGSSNLPWIEISPPYTTTTTTSTSTTTTTTTTTGTTTTTTTATQTTTTTSTVTSTTVTTTSSTATTSTVTTTTTNTVTSTSSTATTTSSTATSSITGSSTTSTATTTSSTATSSTSSTVTTTSSTATTTSSTATSSTSSTVTTTSSTGTTTSSTATSSTSSTVTTTSSTGTTTSSTATSSTSSTTSQTTTSSTATSSTATSTSTTITTTSRTTMTTTSQTTSTTSYTQTTSTSITNTTTALTTAATSSTTVTSTTTTTTTTTSTTQTTTTKTTTTTNTTQTTTTTSSSTTNATNTTGSSTSTSTETETTTDPRARGFMMTFDITTEDGAAAGTYSRTILLAIVLSVVGSTFC